MKDELMKHKALPSVAISFIAMIIIWFVFGIDFSIWTILSILVSSPIIGFFAYCLIANYIEDKSLFVNIMCSLISVFIIFSAIILMKECGCISNSYNEAQERLMDRRMMLRD
jgi:hydrogenase-4 membrane subunit HyfE